MADLTPEDRERLAVMFDRAEHAAFQERGGHLELSAADCAALARYLRQGLELAAPSPDAVCPECKGTGKASDHEDDDDCSLCDGTGTLLDALMGMVGECGGGRHGEGGNVSYELLRRELSDLIARAYPGEVGKALPDDRNEPEKLFTPGALRRLLDCLYNDGYSKLGQQSSVEHCMARLAQECAAIELPPLTAMTPSVLKSLREIHENAAIVCGCDDEDGTHEPGCHVAVVGAWIEAIARQEEVRG